MGAIMRQIIYCVLLIAIWLCSTASVICVLNFGGLGLVLIAGACFASFFSSVALAEAAHPPIRRSPLATHGRTIHLAHPTWF